jgi:hypothetical protein
VASRAYQPLKQPWKEEFVGKGGERSFSRIIKRLESDLKRAEVLKASFEEEWSLSRDF